jgi:hypothetical protein
MTFTSSLPKVAVSTTQGGAVLSMTSKPVQTLQLAPASGVVTSSGSTPLSSSTGKPNVIVVQKGSAAFGRGVSLSHAGKVINIALLACVQRFGLKDFPFNISYILSGSGRKSFIGE